MNLRDQLKDFEGCRLKAYLDTVGVWTIGYGHTGPDAKEGAVWTQEEADNQLDFDIDKAYRLCRKSFPWFDALSEPRQAVIVGMCFQLGLKGLLGFVQTLALVRDECYEDAAEHMRQSKWAKQTPNRARRMAMQMASGEWQ